MGPSRPAAHEIERVASLDATAARRPSAEGLLYVTRCLSRPQTPRNGVCVFLCVRVIPHHGDDQAQQVAEPARASCTAGATALHRRTTVEQSHYAPIGLRVCTICVSPPVALQSRGPRLEPGSSLRRGLRYAALQFLARGLRRGQAGSAPRRCSACKDLRRVVLREATRALRAATPSGRARSATLAVAGVSTLVCALRQAWPARRGMAAPPLSRPSCRRFQQPQAVPARWAVILADALLVSACRSTASSRRWTTTACGRRRLAAARNSATPTDRRLAWRCARPGRPASAGQRRRESAHQPSSRAAARAARRTTLWSASPRRPVVAAVDHVDFPRVVARTGAFFNEHRRHGHFSAS